MEKQVFSACGVTGDGKHDDMLYSSYITGPDGAHYELLKEAHHTKENMDKAKRYLRRNFDVVSIKFINEDTVIQLSATGT